MLTSYHVEGHDSSYAGNAQGAFWAVEGGGGGSSMGESKGTMGTADSTEESEEL
jgi:hypothetical protein